ncbi:MAG TPA: trypsin-like peptidase domain-containing protein [Legionellaceae bacterium]|nr:trypsin-like peptidase domain-containing protein [Legionellaceae bacterium]
MERLYGLFFNCSKSKRVPTDYANGHVISYPGTTSAQGYNSGGNAVECLEIMHDLKSPELEILRKAVAHIRIEEYKCFGTGTMITENLMLTAGHVLRPNEGTTFLASDITLHFNYETPLDGGAINTFEEYCHTYNNKNEAYHYDRNNCTYTVDEIVEIKKTESMDYAILQVNEKFEKDHPDFTYPTLSHADDLVAGSSLVGTLHHPHEEPKKLSFGLIKECSSSMFKHSAHTEEGSSGASMYRVGSNENSIFGIHLRTFDKNNNSGLRIDAISEHSDCVRSLLPRKTF